MSSEFYYLILFEYTFSLYIIFTRVFWVSSREMFVFFEFASFPVTAEIRWKNSSLYIMKLTEWWW